MKASRLLSELMLLQARGRISTRELAERMEVSQRTAHRDMEALCAAGVPLVAWRGSQGGWELETGWRTQVPGFDEEELNAFMMSHSASLGESNLTVAGERALNKIFAAMPRPLQTQAATLRARIYVDPAGWGPWSEDVSPLPVVQEAVARDRKLTFDYQTRDGRKGLRTVDPLGVVCKQNTWYLAAKGDNGVRTYRISRMSNAVMLAEEFERPANFDLPTYWRKSAAELTTRRETFRVTVALCSDAAKEFGKWRPLEPASIEPIGMDLPPEWAIYVVHFDDEGEALFCVLGLGATAMVVEPRHLRERVFAEGQLLLERADAIFRVT